MDLRCSALTDLQVVRGAALVLLWRASARRWSFLVRRAGRPALSCFLYLWTGRGGEGGCKALR